MGFVSLLMQDGSGSGWRVSTLLIGPLRSCGRPCYPVRPAQQGPVSSNGSRAPMEHPTVHSGHENGSDLGRITRSDSPRAFVSSRDGLEVSGVLWPGACFVVLAAGLEAAMQDADEAVAELA